VLGLDERQPVPLLMWERVKDKLLLNSADVLSPPLAINRVCLLRHRIGFRRPVTERRVMATTLDTAVTFDSSSSNPIWMHDASALDPNVSNFYFNAGQFPGVNLPASPRANVVWTFGYNVSAGGGPIVGSEPTLALHFESYYNQGGTDPNPALEWHLQSIDTAGFGHRPLTFYLPRNGGTSIDPAIGQVSVGYFNLSTYYNEQRIKYDMTAVGLTQIFHPVQALYNFGVNNVANAQQTNAEGTGTVALPFIDNFDRTNISGGFIVGVASFSNPQNALAFFLCGGLLNGQALTYGTFTNAVTGTAVADFYEGAASTDLVAKIQNYNSASGHATYYAKAWVGDARFQAEVNGGAIWTWGIDNSDSDKWKLANSSALEIQTRLTVTTTGQLTVGGPVMVQSYAVGSVPSAGTSGAGAIAYIVDGDGGNPCLAVSDGTTWRRISLGAAISST
jgi:hypothetical protein